MLAESNALESILIIFVLHIERDGFFACRIVLVNLSGTLPLEK